jgi:hypothetical protein
LRFLPLSVLSIHAIVALLRLSKVSVVIAYHKSILVALPLEANSVSLGEFAPLFE